MSDDFFKPEDFEFECSLSVLSDAHIIKKITRIANAKLRAHVESLPAVRGVIEHTEYRFDNCVDENRTPATHTARLWDVQPIKKSCAEHEPINGPLENDWHCARCGKKLKAKWEVSDE